MAITHVAKSASMASGTGSISVTVPSGYAQDDLLLLILEGYDDFPATPAGWTHVNYEFNTNTYLRVCRKVAGSSETAVSVADSGNSTRGLMVAFRGVDTSAPIMASQFGGSSGTSFTTQYGLTTTADGAMIVTCVGFWDGDSNDTSNYSSWENASLVSITEGHDESTTAGTGGGIAYAYGIKTVAGTVNPTTAFKDTSSSGNYSAAVMVALRPAATTAIKTINGLAKASVKTVNGLAIASVKTWNGLA